MVHYLSTFSKSFNEFYIKNPDGSSVRSTGWYATEISWSPNGRSIVFPATRYVPLDGHYSLIYLWDLASNAIYQIAALTGFASNPRWSPDGYMIAFTNRKPTSQDEVYVVQSEGSLLTNLTRTANTDERFLNWTPDGRLLIELDQNGESEFYLINPDGPGHSPQPTG